MNPRMPILMALLLAVGCTRPHETVDRSKGARLTIRVTQADEHLGHSTEAGGSGGHPVWIDGCRGRIVEKKEEDLVVWWNNGEIKNYPFQFQDGKTYTLTIKGDFGDGVMGFQGKSIHIGQVLKVEESPQP